MALTLGIIKPDAVKNGSIGNIIAMYEKAGFKIRAMKIIHMTKEEAGGFYEVHKERPFYGELCDFMSSGPCIPLVLEGNDIIAKNRELMGATNPEEAGPGTIRKLYATNIQDNAVHGSDSPENAKIEINYFFNKLEFV
jgi:nucleoside-diphosphate kinase